MVSELSATQLRELETLIDAATAARRSLTTELYKLEANGERAKYIDRFHAFRKAHRLCVAYVAAHDEFLAGRRRVEGSE